MHLPRIISRFLCNHERLCWLYNTHGDQIIEHGYNRTAYHCVDCGKFILKPELVTHEDFRKSCKHDADPQRCCPGNGDEVWTCRMCNQELK